MTAVLTAIVLAAVFTAVGIAKILALAPMPAMAQHLGFSISAYRRIGVLELAGAAGVLLGLRFHWLGVAAAAGVVLLMLGGAISHLRVGDKLVRLALPVTLSAVAIGYAAAL